jgi:hypothetical protein
MKRLGYSREMWPPRVNASRFVYVAELTARKQNKKKNSNEGQSDVAVNIAQVCVVPGPKKT